MAKKTSKVKLNSPKAKPETIKSETGPSDGPVAETTQGGFGYDARNSEVQQINRDPERPRR
jgi:hypothetical protein